MRMCRVFGLEPPGSEPTEVTIGDRVVSCERHVVEGDKELRNDLNSWAAWVEFEAQAEPERWMQHLISTQQIITFEVAEGTPTHEAARWWCERVGGIYHVDDEGMFDAHGQLIAAEDAPV